MGVVWIYIYINFTTTAALTKDARVVCCQAKHVAVLLFKLYKHLVEI
jgi:hypothetical protein